MALPDGIYDRLVDAPLLEELKGLIESGQVTLDRVLAGERPARLAAVISKLAVEALDEMEVEGEGDTRERAQLSVMSALLAPSYFIGRRKMALARIRKQGNDMRRVRRMDGDSSFSCASRVITLTVRSAR